MIQIGRYRLSKEGAGISYWQPEGSSHDYQVAALGLSSKSIPSYPRTSCESANGQQNPASTSNRETHSMERLVFGAFLYLIPIQE